MDQKICIFFVVIWMVLLAHGAHTQTQLDPSSPPSGQSIYEQLYKVDRLSSRKRNQSIYQKLYGNVTRTYEQMRRGCSNENLSEPPDNVKIPPTKVNVFINFFRTMSLQLENTVRIFCMEKLGWHITTTAINTISLCAAILLGLTFVQRLRRNSGSVARRPLPIRNALATNVNIWRSKNDAERNPVAPPQSPENIATSNSLKNDPVTPSASPIPRKEAEWELSADSICSEFRRLSISPEEKERKISQQEDKYEMKPQYVHSEIIDESQHARRIRTTSVWKSVEEKTVYFNNSK